MKDIRFEELDMDSGQGMTEAEVVLEELTIDDDVSTGEGTEADVSADDVFEELDIDDAPKRMTAAEPVVEEITVEPEAEAVVEETAAEPEAETVVEEAVTEPEVEAVVEETVAEPEAEAVVEETAVEPETEAVVEETAVEPETEAVVEEAATEPEVETVAEEAVTEPESEVVVEEIPMEPEAETVAEEPVAEESAAETAEEQKAEMTLETTEPAADEAAEESESVAATPAEDAPAEETGPEPVDAEESETAPEEPALTEASEEVGPGEVEPEETTAVSEAADSEPAADEAAEAQEPEEADAAADPTAEEASSEETDPEVEEASSEETDPEVEEASSEETDPEVEEASSEETDPATDRTPQVLEQRPIQPFWSVEEPEEVRTPVGIVKFVSGALVFVALLAAAYVYGINYYGTHFLPNTYLDGVDVGEMTAAEAKDALRSSFEDYSFTLTGRNGAAEDLDISEAAPAREYEGVEGVLSAQNRVGWIFARTPVKETSLPYTGTFDEEGLDKALDQSALLAAENIAPPENAYITFDPESNHYTIVPEVPGNAVDREVLTKAMGEKLREGQTALDMEEIGCYIAPAISADNARLNQDMAELNTLQDLGASIDMGGEVTEYLNGEQLREMISGESAVSAYVTGLKDRYDTYDKDKRRLFRTAEGTYILMNASYGWRLDEEATLKDLLALTDKAADTVGKSFDLEGILKAMEEAKAAKSAKSSKSSKSSKDSKETEENADPFHITASWKNKAAVHDEQDYGTTYAEVDLTNQTVYVIQDGQTIFTSPCVSGRMTKDRKTPPGIFDIKLKQTNKTLVGYKPDGSVDYRSPVNYWMPFNGGVGFHDATWRGSFGGTIYVNSGSHGCINMPLAKARELYGLVYKGMPVIVYYR